MIQLLFLLLGAEAVRRHWLVLVVVGMMWIILGIAIACEEIENIHEYTMHLLAFILIIEGLTAVAVRMAGFHSKFWQAKAIALIVPGLALIDTPLRNLMLVSIVFGAALMVDSIVRTCSILIVQFPGWRLALVGTAIEFALALLALTPWPVTYEDTIPFCVSVALILSGWTVIRSALVLHRLPPGASVTSLPIFQRHRGWHGLGFAPVPAAERTASPPMIVYVWTAVASTTAPLHRPLIERYVAAIDKAGTVSTGHAALGMGTELYISHYGAEDVDRTGAQFRRALNAGKQNDVVGRFLPSHAAEVAEWCESTVQVEFNRFNAEQLKAFWAAYRQNPTYNLTNRNCSVAVALALDAALEGILAPKRALPPYLRLILNPELYFATLLRQRARTMTWTPGLVLDYARALQRVVEPPGLSWPVMLGHVISRWRKHRGVAA